MPFDQIVDGCVLHRARIRPLPSTLPALDAPVDARLPGDTSAARPAF
jgi:hypothetical protein